MVRKSTYTDMILLLHVLSSCYLWCPISNLSTFEKERTSKQRSICATQPEFSATGPTYIIRALLRSQILAALLCQPSTRAFHHRTPSWQVVNKNPQTPLTTVRIYRRILNIIASYTQNTLKVERNIEEIPGIWK